MGNFGFGSDFRILPMFGSDFRISVTTLVWMERWSVEKDKEKEGKMLKFAFNQKSSKSLRQKMFFFGIVICYLVNFSISFQQI
jgi:hypothetical protein